jgi:hypothetical protein
VSDNLKVFGKTAVFTAIETVAIAGWRALLRVNKILAAGFFAVGLLLEHVVSYNFRNGRKALEFAGLPFVALSGIAGFETVVWIAWWVLASYNAYLAAAVLYVGLLVGHAPELNVMRRFPPFHQFRDRIKRSLDITAIETVTGVAWRALLIAGRPIAAIVILFAGLQIEHLVSGRKRIT